MEDIFVLMEFHFLLDITVIFCQWQMHRV